MDKLKTMQSTLGGGNKKDYINIVNKANALQTIEITESYQPV